MGQVLGCRKVRYCWRTELLTAFLMEGLVAQSTTGIHCNRDSTHWSKRTESFQGGGFRHCRSRSANDCDRYGILRQIDKARLFRQTDSIRFETLAL